MMTRSDFWQMADETRLKAEYIGNQDLQWIQFASHNHLKFIFREYRTFTAYYADDLALLVAKLPLGKLKSMMAGLVYEELGSGNPDDGHVKTLEDFIVSIGVPEGDLMLPTNSANVKLLENLRKKICDKASAYGVAVRGMGGECVCQVYLTILHNYLRKNPYIKENEKAINWAFWDVHAGEADQAHNRMVRAAVDEMMVNDPKCVDTVAAGYQDAKDLVSGFWSTIYREAKQI